MEDFKSEYEMYLHNEHILDFIEPNNDISDVKELILQIYANLLENKVIQKEDMNILNKWIEYF
jgi:hypothetical protein